MDRLQILILEVVKDLLKDKGTAYDSNDLKKDFYEWIYHDPLDRIYTEIFKKAEEYVKEMEIAGEVLDFKV